MHSAGLVNGVSAVLDSALKEIERQGFDTFDPLDPSGTELAQRLLIIRSPVGTAIRRVLWLGLFVFPVRVRRMMGVVPKATAGGVANLASLYSELGGEQNLVKARRCLDWLEENATRERGYIGWGFPFSWKQRLLVLSGTPIGHTTMTCGNAFLKYHHVTRDDGSLEILRGICEFFHSGLLQSARSSGAVAVSYTPLDQMQVINIQADIASLLLRVWKLTGEEKHRDLGVKLLNCVLETQNEDGSWYYYAADALGKPSFIDNHHTGMVLSALAEIQSEALPDERLMGVVHNAITKGTDYFLTKLFTAEGLPKSDDHKLYPLETYNFAQSIITCLDLKTALSDEPQLSVLAEKRLDEVIHHLLDKMISRSGAFLYRRYPYFKQEMGSLRWANALTTAALARFRKAHLPDSADAIPTAILQNR